MTNKEETDVTESQIVRASVLESHGWSSEQNRSQCKFRNKFSCFFCYLFSFRSSLLLFILRDRILDKSTRISFGDCHVKLRNANIYCVSRTILLETKAVNTQIAREKICATSFVV